MTPVPVLDLVKLVARPDRRRIAGTLDLPEETVSATLSSVLARLGLLDRAQLVVLAYESGLVSPGT
ncbi:helix-turn-helix domain-containing protein [Sphaerisporangium corydalis]|uniref:HTH luxR-type domain-containing protein n=1 Tax=Sphaerisporangium corydalis TaxID=1441875 RepID=A0ABV9E6E3_9ACTN|nr:hypothetical protein [Sphaerisporangium corydalis]